MNSLKEFIESCTNILDSRISGLELLVFLNSFKELIEDSAEILESRVSGFGAGSGPLKSLSYQVRSFVYEFLERIS